ncbi:MAG: 30S ribosomal protein S20 [Planctomycetes bacterium]|nr:30S ribosomal protein S20 [Planctomycetota bacterium]MBU1518062.1 30S ribosomal protein S20 [Planctomycetota bacterium]MBU2458501.1 30S ribosomal protein S20 [Planctomycetota bacterium]MBU2596216.1 30S ribosomal protein S20 [Planctomycetota bacterium]
MAHSLSAKKRVRQNTKRRVINRARKSEVKTQIKGLVVALSSGDKKTATEQFKLIVKKLDKVASKGTIHKKKASRLKSRMARKINKLKG